MKKCRHLLMVFLCCCSPPAAPRKVRRKARLAPTPAACAAPPDYSFAVPAGQCAVCGTCPQLSICALWGHENIAFSGFEHLCRAGTAHQPLCPARPAFAAARGLFRRGVCQPWAGQTSPSLPRRIEAWPAAGWNGRRPARLCPQQAGQFFVRGVPARAGRQCTGRNAAGPCRRAPGRKAHCAAKRGGQPVSDGRIFCALPAACPNAGNAAHGRPGQRAGVPVPAALWRRGLRPGALYRLGHVLHHAAKLKKPPRPQQGGGAGNILWGAACGRPLVCFLKTAA